MLRGRSREGAVVWSHSPLAVLHASSQHKVWPEPPLPHSTGAWVWVSVSAHPLFSLLLNSTEWEEGKGKQKQHLHTRLQCNAKLGASARPHPNHLVSWQCWPGSELTALRQSHNPSWSSAIHRGSISISSFMALAGHPRVPGEGPLLPRDKYQKAPN